MKSWTQLNRQLIKEAVLKAIKNGVVQALPIPGTPPDSDLNFLSAQTDVRIKPVELEDYISDLQRDPEMAQFDFTFATLPTSGGVIIRSAGNEGEDISSK
jgi:hypothetical protein